MPAPPSRKRGELCWAAQARKAPESSRPDPLARLKRGWSLSNCPAGGRALTSNGGSCNALSRFQTIRMRSNTTLLRTAQYLRVQAEAFGRVVFVVFAALNGARKLELLYFFRGSRHPLFGISCFLSVGRRKLYTKQPRRSRVPGDLAAGLLSWTHAASSTLPGRCQQPGTHQDGAFSCQSPGLFAGPL